MALDHHTRLTPHTAEETIFISEFNLWLGNDVITARKSTVIILHEKQKNLLLIDIKMLKVHMNQLPWAGCFISENPFRSLFGKRWRITILL